MSVYRTGGILFDAIEALPNNCDNCDISWKSILINEINSNPSKYIKLNQTLTDAYQHHAINPKKENLLRAFRDCPFSDTKVVICGQDPYPDPASAVGLSFSIPAGAKQPPSLKNILKELQDDVGEESLAADGDLSSWARQGVLLLNTSLTVEAGNANSHQALWDGFAINILRRFNELQKRPVAFVLWGKQAEQLGKQLELNTPEMYQRKFIYSVHPSPLSAYRGFFGSRPFTKVNDFLITNQTTPIKW